MRASQGPQSIGANKNLDQGFYKKCYHGESTSARIGMCLGAIGKVLSSLETIRKKPLG